MKDCLNAYAEALSRVIRGVEVTDASSAGVNADRAIDRVIALARAAAGADGKIMFVGNGGSAGIASHSAIDYLRNGGMPAMAFNDGAALTCIGNDFGYEHVFAKQVAAHGRAGDLLIAISSSGRSVNILNAVGAARERGCAVVTFSGFAPDNPLRAVGDLNFYLASDQYGLVELGHQALIHAILDVATGWRGRISAVDGVEFASVECA